MKNTPQKSIDEKLYLLLERTETLSKNIEEVRIDTHNTRGSTARLSLDMIKVIRDIEIIKIDGETSKNKIKEIIQLASEILELMVTQKEFKSITQRVTALEHS